MLDETDVRLTLHSTKSALRIAEELLSLDRSHGYCWYRRYILDLCYAGTGVEIDEDLRRLLIRADLGSAPPLVAGRAYPSNTEAASELCRRVLFEVWEWLEPGEPEGDPLLDRAAGRASDSRHAKSFAKSSPDLPGVVERFLGRADANGDCPLVPFSQAEKRVGEASLDAISVGLFYALQELELGVNISLLSACVTREFEEAIAIGIRDGAVNPSKRSLRNRRNRQKNEPIAADDLNESVADQEWSREMSKSDAGRLLGCNGGKRACRDHLTALLAGDTTVIKSRTPHRHRFLLSWVRSHEPTVVDKFRAD